MLNNEEIRVYVIVQDYYARQAIISFLSWDRRTRVVETGASYHDMVFLLEEDPTSMLNLDIVVMDAAQCEDAYSIFHMVTLLLNHLPEVHVVCLANQPDYDLIKAVEAAGASAFLTRDKVGASIAGALRYTLNHHFTVTRDIVQMLEDGPDAWKFDAETLPSTRRYPRLTPRIEQALRLCVIKGLPAELAAEEMGVSTSTVRSYIKEGYRILESADRTVYSDHVSPIERAFLRYTALEEEAVVLSQTLWESVA